jgi:hypothetical protein
MVTASFTGLVKVIFWFIVIYYTIRFLARIFGPMLIQQVVKKAGQNMYERQQQYNQNNNQQQSYNTPPKTSEKPKEKKTVGEYIDYEEIE